MIFSLGFLSIIGVVTLRNFIVSKDFIPVSGGIGINFYLGNNPRATGLFSAPDNIGINQEDMFRDSRIIADMESGKRLKASEVSRFWLKKAAKFMINNPINYFILLFKKVIYLFSPDEFVHDMEWDYVIKKVRIFKFLLHDLRFILPFSFLGICLGFKNIKNLALLYMALVSLSLSIIIFFVTTRYRMALVPFFILFAGAGLFNILSKFKEKKYLKFGILVISAAIIFIFSTSPRLILAKNASSFEKQQSSAIGHLNAAAIYENSLDYQGALEELKTADNISHDNPRILFKLGLVYAYLNDKYSAKMNFRKVIEICPSCVDAYYNSGFIYNKEGHFLEAQEILEKAKSLDPEDPRILYELGRSYKMLNNVFDAKREFSLALDNISRWRIEDRDLIEKELLALGK